MSFGCSGFNDRLTRCADREVGEQPLHHLYVSSASGFIERFLTLPPIVEGLQLQQIGQGPRAHPAATETQLRSQIQSNSSIERSLQAQLRVKFLSDGWSEIAGDEFFQLGVVSASITQNGVFFRTETRVPKPKSATSAKVNRRLTFEMRSHILRAPTRRRIGVLRITASCCQQLHFVQRITQPNTN